MTSSQNPISRGSMLYYKYCFKNHFHTIYFIMFLPLLPLLQDSSTFLIHPSLHSPDSSVGKM